MSIANTDLVEVLRDGVSYKATGEQIKDYIQINSGTDITYLVVGGGGGGDGHREGMGWGGGGGAGGFLTGTVTLQNGVVYSATVGAGGAFKFNGANSSLSGTGITAITALGGGAGGGYKPTVADKIGADGGSGGGGGAGPIDGTAPTLGGSGAPGQGNAGGPGATDRGGVGGGGGGGAGSIGKGPGPSDTYEIPGGKGGDGKASSITGSSIIYATGGDGCDAPMEIDNLKSGTNGLGEGGRGGRENFPGVEQTGGSGIVILRVPTANYSGITTGSRVISQVGADTVIRFTGNGTYTA